MTPSESQDIGEDDKPDDNKDTLPSQTPVFHNLKLDSVTDRTELVELQFCTSRFLTGHYGQFILLSAGQFTYASHLTARNFSADRVVVPYALRLRSCNLHMTFLLLVSWALRRLMLTFDHISVGYTCLRMLHTTASLVTLVSMKARVRKILPAPLVSVPLISEPWSIQGSP